MSYYTLNDGEKLYYEDVGHGADTLIMMHGWTSSHEVYEKPVETLAGDLNELITGLSLSNITLLGWSMGAGVVFNYVRLYGCGALKQIILCDMTPKQLNDEEWKLGLYQGAYTKADMDRDAGKDFYKLYKEFAVGAVPKLKKIPGFLLKKPLREKLDNCDESVLKSLAKSMKTQDNRDVVEQISVPVTYFYADPGSLFSPELADWYGEHVTTAYRPVRFPECTHMLVTDYPEKFTEEVGKVLQSAHNR